MHSDEISIVQSQISHARHIARLHKKGIYKGFISTLGINFLNVLYRSLITNPHAVVFSAISNNNVIGFICGTTDTESVYKYTLRKFFYRFTFSLIINLLSWKSLKYITETMFYTRIIKHKVQNNEDLKKIKAELLSIAVSDSDRNKGIGSLLIKSLEKYFKEKGIIEYKVIVLKAYEGSNKFYLCNGFKFHSEVIHHDRPEIIYTKEVSNDYQS